MHQELRQKFNSEFSEEKYRHLLNDLNSLFKWDVDFRVSETPVFLTNDFKEKLVTACNEISSQLTTKEFKEKSRLAVPPGLNVPGDSDHPLFLQLDFAAATNGSGDLMPELIELQGFPSLYGYQFYLNRMYKKHFNLPHECSPYFNNFSEEAYVSLFKELVTGNIDPKNVILLEINPEKQKTRIDFSASEELTGIKTVCLTSLIKKDKKLFYESDKKLIPVDRIYNRVIFDELIRTGVQYNFDIRDELDVQWAGHPDWFFRISKHSLPFLHGGFVPECFFLHEVESYPDDLENYVLKPLYSFAGLGVEVDLSKERLDKITERQNYILQKKVEYTPVIATPDEKSKVEIRMMFLWKENSPGPVLVNNLVRMSKGKMMGVDFNKNKTWVGSSIAYF